MRIVYLHQGFYTPNMIGVAGNRSYELARRLVEKGHEVQIVTADTHSQPDSPKDWYSTLEEGIKVHWLPVPYANKMPFRERIGAFVKFASKSATKAASLDGELVYASSGPLTIALPAIYSSVRRRRPLVFEVRDLWPEGAIQLGVLQNPFAKVLARTLERTAYKFSRHIVALSPGMKDGIVGTGVAPEKVSVIPNACDLELFHPRVNGHAMRERFRLEGKFSLGYFGTMGLANGLDFVLDAAAVLKDRAVDDIVFVLHGDGMQRPVLQARAQRQGLANVHFSDPVPEKTKIAEFAAAVDVCMTIYKNVPVLSTCSPNKLFDTFAAGKPALTNMPGALQRLVEDNACGVFVEPDNPQDFADKVIALRDSPAERLLAYGRNARRLGETMFSRDVLANNLARILEAVEQTGQGPNPPLEDGWQ